MRRSSSLLLFCCLLVAAVSANAATGRVIKVLPQFLDAEGRSALSPSLYERDAYQAFLREHPQQRSGIRFAVEWKTHGPVFSPLRLEVDLLGTTPGGEPSRLTLKTKLKPGGWFSHWTSLRLTGAAYRKFGDVSAWRVRLWEGRRLLGEQKSFLW